ncbi:MAG: primosomal protein N' [Candidatus Magasanikbacteria bacterium]|nr:primosomal protein N' [Candidatus Magasanikbacteria bacterium]
MIAKVIPLQRLPRHLSEFDYTIPAELAGRVKIGQMVEIPWRQSKCLGLVFALSRQTNRELKTIEQILNPEPFLGETYINLLLELGKWYGMSPSTLIKMALPPLQKNKIKKLELKKNKFKSAAKQTKIIFEQYQGESEHRTQLTKHLKNKTLILVPEVNLIDEVRQLLPVEMQEKIIVWHSGLSQKQQFENWTRIRNREKEIIIGTRGAVFLPFDGLKSIIIDYEHDENHKHWDQAPRFHAKDIAERLAKENNATLTLMSFTPACASYFAVHKSKFRGKLNLTPRKTEIADMREERLGGNYGALAESTMRAITDSKQDIFVYVNRLGFATSVGCNECGHIERCEHCETALVYHEKTQTLHCHYCRTGKPMIMVCPKCRSVISRLYGAGTEFVEKEVRRLFGAEPNREVIRIDSDSKIEMRNESAKRCIIGTRTAFERVRWPRTDLVVFLDIDRQMNIPEYLAQENIWHLIQTVYYYKSADCRFIIQTSQENNLICRSLTEPDRFYRTTLNARRALNYPPYSYLTRYFYGHNNAAGAQKEAELVASELRRRLTKMSKSTILLGPIEMHPKFYRRQFWYEILIKLPVDTWQEDLKYLNQFIPETWKIDPNPISVLSP